MSDERPNYESGEDNFDVDAWRKNKYKAKPMPINNEWEVKFNREGVFMPFGSLCNAYGQVNQQKGAGMKSNEVRIDKFIEDMKQLYALSVEMVEDSIKRTHPKGEAVYEDGKYKLK